MKAESSRAPYYIKFHIGDYLRDCEELSLTQHGAYLRLMLWYYAAAKPIPNEPDRIYRRVHAMSTEERHAVDYVLTEFFVLDGPVWRHKRIDQELSTWNDYSEQQSARIKKRHEINKNYSTSVEPALYQCNTNQNQNHNQNHKKTKSKAFVSQKLDLVVPDWIPQEQWTAFVEMRKKIKKPLTANASVLAFRKLESLCAKSTDLAKQVLEQSVFRSWAGLFPVSEPVAAFKSPERPKVLVEMEKPVAASREGRSVGLAELKAAIK